MCVAMTHLVKEARADGHQVEDENLYGEHLHLLITEAGDGVMVTVSWAPEEPGEEAGSETPMR